MFQVAYWKLNISLVLNKNPWNHISILRSSASRAYGVLSSTKSNLVMVLFILELKTSATKTTVKHWLKIWKPFEFTKNNSWKKSKSFDETLVFVCDIAAVSEFWETSKLSLVNTRSKKSIILPGLLLSFESIFRKKTFNLVVEFFSWSGLFRGRIILLWCLGESLLSFLQHMWRSTTLS